MTRRVLIKGGTVLSLDRAVGNMVTAIELTQKVIDPMVRRKFGRIVNITSGTVKMPLAGLDLSSGSTIRKGSMCCKRSR